MEETVIGLQLIFLFAGKKGAGGKVSGVLLDNGVLLAADVVVMGAGVVPSTSIFKGFLFLSLFNCFKMFVFVQKGLQRREMLPLWWMHSCLLLPTTRCECFFLSLFFSFSNLFSVIAEETLLDIRIIARTTRSFASNTWAWRSSTEK